MKRVVLVAGILFFAGCTHPGEQTGVGAATGGVIGAGLGAIVGNQVGNAGTGLAIGAAAGAATGGLIANAFEAQEKAIKTQDEAIERQEQRLASQRGEIEELRRLNGDSTTSVHSVAARGSSGGSGVSNSGTTRAANGHIRLNPPNLTGTKFDTSARASMSMSAVNGSSETKPFGSQSGWSSPAKTTGAGALVESELETSTSTTTNTDLDQAAALERARSIDAATTAATITSGSELVEEEVVVESESVKQAAVKSETAPVENAKIAPAARLPTAEDLSPDCRQAEDEARQAKNATDNADKLFHFRRALRLCPGKAEYHIGLGEVYKVMNRKSDADFEFNEALRLDPNSEKAQTLLSSN